MVRHRSGLEGSSHLVLAGGVGLLHPEEAVLAAMLSGWRAQQTARRLASSTMATRERSVRRFAAFTNDYPWQWSAGDIEEWTVSLMARGGGLSHASVRAYQQAVALFMDYVCDPRYGWAGECEARFGTHPVQICHEWNTAAHAYGYEGRPGRRPLTRGELQGLFDHADEQVAVVRRLGRKGWLAAFRDATLLKTIYAFGLRRREAVMLDVVDFTANPAAPEFGRYGMLAVRYGKASRGSAPRRRNVLCVMEWVPDALAEWVEEIRPAYAAGPTGPLWPTERRGRIRAADLAVRFATYRDEIGLPEELTLHCLRHSYVTHQIEDGFDPFFVQQQVGHAWGSTTALYTGVSSDYKNQVLRAALDRALGRNDDEQA